MTVDKYQDMRTQQRWLRNLIHTATKLVMNNSEDAHCGTVSFDSESFLTCIILKPTTKSNLVLPEIHACAFKDCQDQDHLICDA